MVVSEEGIDGSAMRAILSGYYGFGNGGDEALLTSLLQMLPPDVEPIVLTQTPQETCSAYNVSTASRWDGLTLQRLLRSADLFVWGGGSLLQDRTSWRNPLYYSGLMGLAQQSGLRTVAWAQGLGPLQRGWTRSLARWCLQRCSAVSVRDRASAQLLQDWGIPYHLAPDPVWALQAQYIPRTWPAPAIAVVLRAHPLLTPARIAILQQALVQLQAATQAYVVLLPFQRGADETLAQQLQACLPESSEVLYIAEPRQLKGVFRGMALAIAMRLHGAIVAAAEGVPTFGLSYDPKVSQLLQELELPGYELAQLPDDPGSIARAWARHFQGPGLPAEQLETLHNQALTHAHLLLEP